MKLYISLILFIMISSCANVDRWPSSLEPVSSADADVILKALKGNVIKYSSYNMSKAYFESVSGSCIVSGEDDSAVMSCNGKKIASKQLVNQILHLLNKNVLVYSGFNMGKAYYDIQGGVICIYSSENKNGQEKSNSFKCE